MKVYEILHAVFAVDGPGANYYATKAEAIKDAKEVAAENPHNGDVTVDLITFTTGRTNLIRLLNQRGWQDGGRKTVFVAKVKQESKP